MNEQPIRKVRNYEDGQVMVHSIFSTIQGEGPFAGRPAVFLRLEGCNLRCPMCDTEYTGGWLASPLAIFSLIQEQHDAPYLVVITGGEPFRQGIGPLVEYLHHRGYTIQIETNGTLWDYSFPAERATIVCSPKTGKIAKGLKPHIHSLKYVLHKDDISEEDGLPTKVLGHPAYPHVARPSPEMVKLKNVYVQPVDENEETNPQHLKATINSAVKHGYTLCLQLHKIIGLD